MTAPANDEKSIFADKKYGDLIRSYGASLLLMLGAIYLLAAVCRSVWTAQGISAEEIAFFVFLILLVSGILDSLAEISVGGFRAKFKEVVEKQQKQEAEIVAIKVALLGITTNDEYEKLLGLSHDGPFLCYYSDDMFSELKRLRSMGMVMHHAGTGLAPMRNEQKNTGQEFDLKNYFHITKQGIDYLKLREDIQRADEEAEQA